MCAGSDVYFCIKRQQPAAGLEFQRACVNWEAVYSLLMKSLTDTSGHVRIKSSRGEAQAQPECCQSVKVCYNQPSTASPVTFSSLCGIFSEGVECHAECRVPVVDCTLLDGVGVFGIRRALSIWGNVIAVRGMNKL